MTSPESPKGILWLKLDDPSRNQLLERFPPQYSEAYYDHVTLAFGTTREVVSQLIGAAASCQVYAYARNNDIEAVRVDTHGLPDTYGVPHITLSARAGVEPFASVAMLKGEHEEQALNQPLELSGHIEFITL